MHDDISTLRLLQFMILLQVEKEIGQVWRQMGIMYSKVSNSIEILEKVIHKITDM